MPMMNWFTSVLISTRVYIGLESKYYELYYFADEEKLFIPIAFVSNHTYIRTNQSYTIYLSINEKSYRFVNIILVEQYVKL